MKQKYSLFKFFTILALTGFLYSTSAYGQATLKHSYDFEDGTANDVVGTAHGTVVGGTIAAGAYTAAVNGDIIELPAADIAINTYTAVTLEAYIFADVDNTGATMLVYFGGNVNNLGGDGYFFTPDRWTESRTGISCGNLTQPWTVEDGVTGSPVAVGEKHHLVSVLAGDSIAWYIDGALVGSNLLTGNNSIANISNVNAWLCKGGYSNDPSWAGTIHEFNIYEGALTGTEVSNHSLAFLGSSDARLSALASDLGTLTPAFSDQVTHYAIAVPGGTTSVNITATSLIPGASVVGDGAVDISGGETTASIVVTSVDGTVEKTYTIDILFEQGDCYTPLYPQYTNLIPDPEMTDVSLMGGWGQKSNVFGFDAYCGLTAAKLVDGDGSGCTAALDLGGLAWNPNSAYRVRAMVKTIGGSIGVLANAADPNFGFAFDSNGEWAQLDTILYTGASAGTGFFSFNTCDFGSNATETYVDNFEIYEISMDSTLADLQVSGTSINGFDSIVFTYDVVLPDGTTDVPVVTGIPEATYADVVVTDATALPGTTTIEVTAEDGVGTTLYTINFTLADPDTAHITFLVDDTDQGTATGFGIKGSWVTETGRYDASWSDGAEHEKFFDDGTHGDATAGDHIWTVTLNIIPDGGANTWEWGVNDADGNWIDGNFQFTVADAADQTLEAFVIVGLNHFGVNRYTVYPNPASSELHIDEAAMISKVEVFNISGKQMIQKLNAGSSSIALSVTNLDAGVYLIKITDMNNQFSHQKLIVE